MEGRSFSDLYLTWNTTASVDNVLSNGAEYGTIYPMAQWRTGLPGRRGRRPDGQGAVSGTSRLAWIHAEQRLYPEFETPRTLQGTVLDLRQAVWS